MLGKKTQSKSFPRWEATYIGGPYDGKSIVLNETNINTWQPPENYLLETLDSGNALVWQGEGSRSSV